MPTTPKPSGIGGAMRGLPHDHQWIEIRGAPTWMVDYGFAPASGYRLCWPCGDMEPLEEPDALATERD